MTDNDMLSDTPLWYPFNRLQSTIQEAQDMTEQSNPRQVLEARIIEKAWKDDAFRQELLRDPQGVAERELGVFIPEGLNIQVHEESPTTMHLVIPMNPAAQRTELSDRELEAVAGGHACGWNTTCHFTV